MKSNNIVSKGTFKKNPTINGIYDLEALTGVPMPFSYFRIEQPRESYLHSQKAVLMAVSHKGSVKVLHSGLRRTAKENVYLADTGYNEKPRRLLVFHYIEEVNSFDVYLYKNYPRNIKDIVERVSND